MEYRLLRAKGTYRIPLVIYQFDVENGGPFMDDQMLILPLEVVQNHGWSI